jgi:hypothetical protein
VARAGHPADQPPELVALDENAWCRSRRANHGVAVDPVGFAVNEAETKRLRAQPPGAWEVSIDEQGSLSTWFRTVA